MIGAVIFDKDGTLFDFRASWGNWTRRMIAFLVQNGADLERTIATLGFDPETGVFADDSPVIAATTPEIAIIVAPLVPGLGLDAVNAKMNEFAASAAMSPAVDLPEVLGALRRQGLALGLATNDTEVPARAHLDGAGVLDLFSFVAGCDSGYGGKPAPGQLLAFAKAVGLPAARIAMVGDSRHDLDAAAAAGMLRVAVLTGIAQAAELAPHADVVLPDIGHLGAWIAARPVV